MSLSGTLALSYLMLLWDNVMSASPVHLGTMLKQMRDVLTPHGVWHQSVTLGAALGLAQRREGPLARLSDEVYQRGIK